MGQQQILLVVLVFVIVAIIVAVDTLQQSQDSSVHDATRIDILRAINSAQKYYLSPESTGGGGNSFDGINFNDVIIDSVNENASFTLSGSGNTLTITGRNDRYNVNLRATVVITPSETPEITWEDL